MKYSSLQIRQIRGQALRLSPIYYRILIRRSCSAIHSRSRFVFARRVFHQAIDIDLRRRHDAGPTCPAAARTCQGGAMVPQTSIANFQSSLSGTLLFPGEPAYEQARKIHNGMIDRKPSLIVQCETVHDVLAAVDFARRHGETVSVRGAGHNVAGTSLCDDALLIDLSTMKGIRVDADTQIAHAEPGVTWAECNNALQPFGLAATGGYVGTTGVSGLTLGGGLGWMVRKYEFA